MVMDAVSVRVPREQTRGAPEQPGDADTRVTVVGSVSVMMTLVAVIGLLRLETTSVYVSV